MKLYTALIAILLLLTTSCRSKQVTTTRHQTATQTTIHHSADTLIAVATTQELHAYVDTTLTQATITETHYDTLGRITLTKVTDYTAKRKISAQSVKESTLQARHTTSTADTTHTEARTAETQQIRTTSPVREASRWNYSLALLIAVCIAGYVLWRKLK